MKSMKDTKNDIYNLGKKLVGDGQFYKKYKDVNCDVARGILPRCLIYEERKGARGCVMVGINPGNDPRIAKHERKFFIENGCSYDALIKEWEEGPGNGKPIKEHPYYARLRELSMRLGFSGPILWTELVKCESKKVGKKNVPLSNQTIRDDIHYHLLKEIEAAPDDWPLIGVGSKAYEILTFNFADRLVVGIPHPTSSRGQFSQLMKMGNHPRQMLDALLKEKRTTVTFRCGKDACRLT